MPGNCIVGMYFIVVQIRGPYQGPTRKLLESRGRAVALESMMYVALFNAALALAGLVRKGLVYVYVYKYTPEIQT